MSQQYTKSPFFISFSLNHAIDFERMRVELKGLNTQHIMSKIGRANEQNRPNLEELQQRKIGSFWSIIGSGLTVTYSS